MLKRLIATLFLIFMMSPAFAIEDNFLINVFLPNSGFVDIPNKYWAEEEITSLARKGIIKGYPNHKFKPESNLTRAEFCALVIKALELENYTVIEPIAFDDFYRGHWAYDSVQKAIYFNLISTPKPTKEGYYFFNPEDKIIRGSAITLAVNAIGKTKITRKKALSELENNYIDAFKIPEWFIIPAGKAVILDMMVVAPNKERAIECNRPITRAEAAVLVYNMLEEVKQNPNDKLKESITPNLAEGQVIQTAMVDGTVGTIPKGSILPVLITERLTSQTSVKNEEFNAIVPRNYVSMDKTLLIAEGTKFKGQVTEVKRAFPLFKDGILVLETNTLETKNGQVVRVRAIARNSLKDRLIKGRKIINDRAAIVYLELLHDIKIDVTNGKILPQHL